MTTSREMLSGPDLGGGYLHQLSRDRTGSVSGFTYHAQEGGIDAQGPPRGPLDVLGFEITETPCQFGGRGCWHREFALPASDADAVRRAYNRWRFVSAALLEQRYASAAVPLDAALAELADRVLAPLARRGIPAWIGGSTSAFLQGIAVSPRGISLGTSREGVKEIGAALLDFLIEPVAPTRWGGALRYAGRAFVGTLVAGVRVQFAAPAGAASAPGSAREWSLPADRVPTVTVERDGRSYAASRLEFALLRAVEQGDLANSRAIAARLAADPAAPSLLGPMLEGATPEVRRIVGELIPRG